MLTVERWRNQQIIEALKRTNGLVSLAAQNLGCSPQTIYNRAKRVPSVQQVIDDSRDGLVDLAELALRRCIVGDREKGIEPAGWAVALVAKTLGKKRGYVERQEIEQSGEVLIRVVRDRTDGAAAHAASETSGVSKE